MEGSGHMTKSVLVVKLECQLAFSILIVDLSSLSSRMLKSVQWY